MSIVSVVSTKMKVAGEGGKTEFEKREDPIKASFEINFGDTTSELVEELGESVAYSMASQGITLGAQNASRNFLSGVEELNQAELQAHMDEWVPGVRQARKAPIDPMESARQLLKDMSPQERKEFLKEINS